MKEICNRESCTGCSACVQACPVGCIRMIENREGFIYPMIDEQKCINCNKCAKVCHVNNSFINTHSPDYYMATHKDIAVLRNSSSGGAFTAIADYVLQHKGVVYGASFSPKSNSVFHVAIENSIDLDLIRLSKYFQGSINDCYKDVKKTLKERMVLFSGTACQIAGLYSFLGSEYYNDNLITIDVLCHGFASRKVVEAYIKCKEKKYKKRIVDYRFRLKPDDSDWINGGGTRMRLDFSDNTSRVQSKEFDSFFVGFNHYLFLRESCYACKYCGEKRISDFTLADYWGVPEDEISIREKKYGVSLVLCNSEKSKTILNDLMIDLEIKRINPERAIACNQALRHPGKRNPYRSIFFEELSTYNFDRLIHKIYREYYVKTFARQVIIRIIGEERFREWRYKKR